MLWVISRLFAFVFSILESIVVALALFVVVYLFLYQPHQVKGASMEPNFHDGEYILTNKYEYRFGDPKRGDVIVFRSPQNPDVDFIKRIIGLPGDRVKLVNNVYYINGVELTESYLPERIYMYSGSYLHEGDEIVVPPDHYFVSGDNRPRSSDSREWGPIERASIIGKSQVRYFPFDKFGVIPLPVYPNIPGANEF